MKALLVGKESGVVSQALDEIGIRFDIATSDDYAIRLCRQNSYSLYIVNVRLNRLSGIEFCRILRTKTNAPVIMTSKEHNDAESVACFDAGADDYIFEPYCRLELECRVRAIMKRCMQSPFVTIDWLDFDNCSAFIDDREIKLTRIEFDLLSVLAAANGRAVSKKTLIIEVWGSFSLANDDVLKTRISSLRSKIGKGKIVTVRGFGYKLVE